MPQEKSLLADDMRLPEIVRSAGARRFEAAQDAVGGERKLKKLLANEAQARRQLIPAGHCEQTILAILALADLDRF